MSVFFMDFAEISDAIKGYENLLKKLEIWNSVLVDTTSAVDVDIYSGSDADLLRAEWELKSTEDIPYVIEKITSIKEALVEARTEFIECKIYCNNFANAFDISTYMVHPTGVNGILKCDYDDATLAIGNCNNIIDYCEDIRENVEVNKNKFSGFHGSYDDIYNLLDKIKTDSENISGKITAHKSDINTYASMVTEVDERLNNRFKELIFNDLDFAKVYMLSCPEAFVVGTKLGFRGFLDNTDPLVLLLTALTDGVESLDDNQKKIVLDYLDEKMHQDLTDPITGELVHSPFEQLTYDERELYVKCFEDLNANMVGKMENIQKAFEEDGYDGWEIDVTNIKFLLYSADDPYRSLYLNYADEINIATVSLDPKNIEFHRNGSIFIDHTKMDEEKYGEMAYHSFFHEYGHFLDYKMGSYYGQGVWFSEYYTTDILSNYVLKDVLFDDVKNTISETFDEKWEIEKSEYLATGNYNNYSGQKWLYEKKNEYKERVMDATINQLDYNAFGTPYFGESEDDLMAAKLYESVRIPIYAELHNNMIAKDVYGLYTGNTFNDKSGHSVILNQWDPEKATYCELYHIESGTIYSSKINMDGSGLKIVLDDGTTLSLDPNLNYIKDYSELNADAKKKTNIIEEKMDFADEIIQSEGNLVHNSNAGKEFLANDLSAHITQNPERLKGLDYFDETTITFLDGLVKQMADL